MMYATFDLSFRVGFPLPRLARIDLFKMCTRFNESNDNTIKMTFELKAMDEFVIFEELTRTVRSVRQVIADCGDERAGMYGLVIVAMQVRVRRGR